jgi:hypothetical protein
MPSIASLSESSAHAFAGISSVVDNNITSTSVELLYLPKMHIVLNSKFFQRKPRVLQHIISGV